MSLATNIKEFADVLHNIYAQQLSSINSTDIVSDGALPLAIPKLVVLQQALIYLAKSLGSGVFYFISFQWLRDFSYFPLLSPEIGNGSSIASDTFLSEPFSYLFSFSKSGVNLISSNVPNETLHLKQNLSLPFTSFLKTDQLFAGFVNSFFFSLPFSLPHLITLRRMFSQGAAAAAASVFGTVAAHSLLLVGVLYGLRFLIIPYYFFQPLTFLIGTVTIAVVITEFVKEKRVYLVPLTHYPSLVRIGTLTFILALCESATVFHDLHHLTLNQQISFLQLYESQNALDSFFIHTAYLLAFVLGHTAFSFLFCYGILKGNEKICSLTGWTLPKTARQINKALLVFIITLTFCGFPYYGLDYLFTKSAGFLPEDPAYINTVFSPTQVRSRNRHFKSRQYATKNSKTPLELDLNYFDRGMYLNAPKEEKVTSDPDLTDISTSSLTGNDPLSKPETVATYDPALTFEELNYQGESAWLMRHERARRLPEEQDSKKESVFQKPKTHFKQLRLKQDNKQAEAALREVSQVGSVSEWKEGIRPGETLSPHNAPGSHLAAENQSEISPDPRISSPNKSPIGKPLVKATGQSTSTKQENLAHGRVQDKKALSKELAFEKEIASNYEKSFTSPFGEDSDGTPPDLLPVENIIKKRYRLNPVYRALLQTDIDSFIARQPANYRITQNQEANLFKKRQLLEKYYNSIRYYSPVESVGFTKRYLTHVNDGTLHSIAKKTEFDHSSSKDDDYKTLTDRKVSFGNLSSPSTRFTKSFIETIYHQQFKGTLNTVKRFFKLTFDEQQNPNKNRVLSYDQMLYKNRNLSLSSQKERFDGVQGKVFDEKYHPSLHEELDLERVSPFIEESNSAPIYAGWDNKARRFVITNRFNLAQ